MDIHGYLFAKKHEQVYMCLLMNKNLVNQKNSRGQTPLLVAAIEEDVKMVRLILNFGPDLTLKDDLNMAPLDVAKFNNSWEITHLIEASLSKIPR